MSHLIALVILILGIILIKSVCSTVTKISGTINQSNINNESSISVTTVNGTVTCTTGETITVGDITIKLTNCLATIDVHGDVSGDIQTVNGEIKVGNVGGSVTTTNGDVKCGDVNGNVRTVNGDIIRYTVNKKSLDCNSPLQ